MFESGGGSGGRWVELRVWGAGLGLTISRVKGWGLGITRYCYYQYCKVYSTQIGVWMGSRILPNHRAIVLHQGGKCRWAGRMKGWLIRAQQFE